MIVEWLVSVGASVATWITGLFPQLEIPDAILNLDQSINDIFDMGHGLAPWINLPVIIVIAAVPLTVWAWGLGVMIFRVLASHIPFIGGKG